MRQIHHTTLHNLPFKILFFLISCFTVNHTIAQQTGFSQYHVSPFNVNPSYIGKDVIDWRLGVNLRSNSLEGGGASTLNTTTVGLEKNLFANTDKTSQFGIGMMMLNDGGGDEVLRSNYLGLAVSYNLQITENSQIGLGLSAHHANRFIDMSTIRFESQFGSDGFQNSIPSGEYNFLPNSSYWSLNQGINYTFNKENWGYLIGAAYFNSNKPLEGFFAENKYPIKPKVTYQTRFWMHLGGMDSDKSIHLSHLSEYQGAEKVHTVGAIYKYGFANSGLIRSLNIGFYKRFSERSYPYLAIETNKWIAGLSYDITDADKSTMGSSKSVELSFIMQLTGPKARDKRYTIDNIIGY